MIIHLLLWLLHEWTQHHHHHHGLGPVPVPTWPHHPVPPAVCTPGGVCTS